jgi:hypothetical protein
MYIKLECDEYIMIRAKFVGLVTILVCSEMIYEQYTNYRYRIALIYYTNRERMAIRMAEHEYVMNVLRTKCEVRNALLKCIRAPFSITGAIGGIVERGATTIEHVSVNMFTIVEIVLRTLSILLQTIGPYVLALIVVITFIRRIKS